MEKLDPVTRRSDFLSALCILSFIGLGWRILKASFGAIAGIFSTTISAALGEAVDDLDRDSDPASHFAKGIIHGLQSLFDHISTIALLIFLLSLVALTGVIMMWNMKRTGYIIYTISRILILMVPVLVMGVNFLSLLMIASGTVFAALFIALYGINLKNMN